MEAPQAHEWARVAAIETLCWFVHKDEIALAEARTMFSGWFETLQPRETNDVWYGLQSGVALLGLADLEPLVARAFRQKLVDASILNFEDFQEDLRAARADRDGFFEQRGLNPMEDAVAALEVFDVEAEDLEPPAPVENNSGTSAATTPAHAAAARNYKKCCLGADRS